MVLQLIKKEERIHENITVGFSGQSSYSSKEYNYNGKINLEFNSSQDSSPKKISIVNDVNEVTISERKITPSSSILIDVNENIKFAPGDKLTTYAMVQDRYGLNYKYVINVFEVNSNGKLVTDHFELQMQRLSEIKDKNGKILYAPKNDIVK